MHEKDIFSKKFKNLPKKPIDRKKYPFFTEERLLKVKFSGTFGPPHECIDKTIEIIRSCDGGYYCTYTRMNEFFYPIKSKSPIDNETVNEFKKMLSKINIPAFATFDGYGCDGGLTEIEMGKGSTNTHLRWWFTPPGWEELDRTTGYIIHTVVDKFISKQGEDIDKDLSSKFNSMRKAQNIIKDYLINNYTPKELKKELQKKFAINLTNSENRISYFDSEKAFRTLDEIEELKNNITWFIDCYLAYYNEFHRYSHTFKHLEYVGLPTQLLSELREIKEKSYQEESVVLALLQTLLDGEAKGKWGEVLPTVFQRQINKANLPKGLVDSVTKVVAGNYR